MQKINRRIRGMGTAVVNVLICEKINYRYKKMTSSENNCGLSVCTKMIASSISDSKVIGCIDHNELIRKIKEHNPKIVIIEALWVKSELIKDLEKRMPNTKFFVHLHSNLGFLAVESYAIGMIKQYLNDNIGIIFNSLGTYNCFKKYPNVHLLPNIYNKEFLDIKIKDTEHLDIGCFGSVRPMKNHLMQAAGAVLYAEKVNKKLRFHVNLCRDEDGGEAVKKNLNAFFNINYKHELVGQGCQTQDDFINSIRLMDVSMQVSMSETYNIVCADTVAAGVPMVTSSEVEWASELCYAKHSDPEDICEKIGLVIKSPLITNINRGNLKAFNEFAMNKWAEFIGAHG